MRGCQMIFPLLSQQELDIVAAGIDWISTDVLTKMVFSTEETVKRGNLAELPGTAHETIEVPSKCRPTNPMF